MGTCRILLLEFTGQGSVAQELKSLLSESAPTVAVQHELVCGADKERVCRWALNGLADLCFLVADGSAAETRTVLQRLNETLPALPILVVVNSQEQPGEILGLANDFLMAPLRPAEVMSRVRHWTRFRCAEEADVAQIKAKIGLKQLVGSSA